MKTLVYALALCFVMVGRADAASNPTPTYVCDKLVAAYFSPIDNFVDPGYMRRLSAKCHTPDRVHYRVVFTVHEKQGSFHLNFTGTVHRGNRRTFINRFLEGRVHLTSSRYISMLFDDLSPEWLSA